MKGKMKKIISLVLVLAISIMTYVPAFAQTERNVTDKQIDEVVNTGKILNSTDEYIIFSKTEIVPSSSGYNIFSACKDKGIENSVNKIQTNVALVSLDGNVQKLLNAVNSNGGSVERSKSDGSYSATITTRVFYTEYNKNGKQYFGIDKVVGNIQGGGSGSNLGSNIKIIDNYATIGQEGLAPDGRHHICSDTYNISVNKRNWTYYTPSSWDSVPVANTFDNYAGANYFVKLQRGTRSWDIAMSNDIFGRNNL
jgi:competence protein ComGC